MRNVEEVPWKARTETPILKKQKFVSRLSVRLGYGWCRQTNIQTSIPPEGRAVQVSRVDNDNRSERYFRDSRRSPTAVLKNPSTCQTHDTAPASYHETNTAMRNEIHTRRSRGAAGRCACSRSDIEKEDCRDLPRETGRKRSPTTSL